MKAKSYIRPKTAVPQFREENGFYTTKTRSFNMSMIKGKNTKPEKLLKKALWHAGIRFRSPKKPLPGKPDVSLKKYKLVVFVDGTFWHGYDWQKQKHTIKSNREFWIAKIERNIERDQEVNAYCRAKGWTVLRFWDFEVKQPRYLHGQSSGSFPATNKKISQNIVFNILNILYGLLNL